MKMQEKEIKERLLKLLSNFDKICKAHHLSYSLGYGTLLGAVRHSGFIPWDDDIDVIMPQEDYLQFLSLECFKNQDMNADVVLYEANNENMKNKGYMYPFAKLIDGRTYIKSDVFREVGGIWIDIFPVTGLPNQEDAVKKHFKKMNRWHLQLAAAHRYRNLSECNLIIALKQIRCNYYNLIHKSIVQKMKKLAFSVPYDSSDLVAVSMWNYGVIEIMSKDYFNEYIDVNFEGEKFSGLKQYDEYLTKLYGNWNQLPSEDKRVAHHYYKVYIK